MQHVDLSSKKATVFSRRLIDGLTFIIPILSEINQAYISGFIYFNLCAQNLKISMIYQIKIIVDTDYFIYLATHGYTYSLQIDFA